MTNHNMPEPSHSHDLTVEDGQLDPSAGPKKPFVEPTLSPSVSLPDVTAGSLVGTVSP